MTPEEIAYQMFADGIPLDKKDGGIRHVDWKQLESKVADAIREARNGALEEAAQANEFVVTCSIDHMDYAPTDDSPCGFCDGLEEGARRIRALKAEGTT